MYKNKNPASPLLAVEFTPVADGNFTYFYASTRENKQPLKDWLTGHGQEIVAETLVDGKTVLVTHGDKTKEEMTKALEERGDKLELVKHKKKFNAWAWRGNMSNVGQVLQVMSAAMKPKGIDSATMTFGLSNLAANMTNLVFGGEEREDINGERTLKGKINKGLGSYLAGDDPLPEDDDRLGLRKEAKEAPSAGDKAYGFMKQNSVKIGEIGLRYFGAFNMLAPVFKGKQEWQKVFTALGEGKMGAAWKSFRNPDKANFWVGVLYLFGKTLALTSKIPDPYDPTPKTALDEFREKYAFKLSSIIEGVGAATIASSRLKPGTKVNPGKVLDKIGFNFGNKQWDRDYLGGIGGLLFMGGFAIRLAAPFGTRKLDMDEIYAHATDTLAKTPPEKLPQLLADTAATMKEHLKDQPIEYGEIFNKMMTDMYRYHHIALNNLGTEPEERNARMLNKCMTGVPGADDERTMARCLDGVAGSNIPPSGTKTPLPANAIPASVQAEHNAKILNKCLTDTPGADDERTMARCLDGITAANIPSSASQNAPESMVTKYAANNAPRRTSERVSTPTGSHSEKAAKSTDVPAVPQVGV